MQQAGPENIRNLALLSHNGAGKTSLTEAILFTTGVINRMGRVDDGTTTSDYDPDEVKRRMSINLKLIPFKWQNTKINIIDTPGYSDFVTEVKASLKVVESAIIVVEAAAGVEVGTEQVWGYCNETGLPRLVLINKMDRENADFFKTMDMVRAKFGQKCVAVQLPIGAQNTFQGVIDLLTMKAYTGTKAEESAIPAAMQSQAGSYREKLIEAVAETDDRLIEKYLNGEELLPDEIKSALGKAVAAGKIMPALASAGAANIGTIPLLNAIIHYLPSPKDKAVVIMRDSTEQEIKPDPAGPLVALVFKTSADPYVGKLTYFRVFNGAIASNSQVWNVNRNEPERIGQLYLMRGKNQEAVPQVMTGDLGVVAKLNVTSTGDTLGARDNPIKLQVITFPEPIFSQAVHPKTKADLDKLGAALSRLAEEDSSLKVHRDPDTAETIMSGLGETHLAVAADRMMRKFGVAVELTTPKVPYKETITVATKAEFKHKKQSGGHGQYGHVLLELEPLPRSSGFVFADKVVGGAIPRNFIPAVEKGVTEAISEGTIAGFPVVDVRATVYDGSFHPVDSSEMAFKIAGAGAFKKGLDQAQPILLEPIMTLKVKVPNEFTGDIISDLNSKRARMQGMSPEGDTNVIEAEAPLSEIQRYAIDLKSITQGRGSFTVQLSHYEPVPANVTQKIAAERQAEKQAEKAAAK